MQMADRGLASPSSTRLDFHCIDAVLALYGPIQRNLGVVGWATIPAVPVSDEPLHKALSFSPNAGDGRVPFGGRGPSEGIGGRSVSRGREISRGSAARVCFRPDEPRPSFQVVSSKDYE